MQININYSRDIFCMNSIILHKILQQDLSNMFNKWFAKYYCKNVKKRALDQQLIFYRNKMFNKNLKIFSIKYYKKNIILF